MIYKFTLVWYSAKQDTTHRPTSHLAHIYTVPFLWPREEHRQQHSLVEDFSGQCLLWGLSNLKTFFASTLHLQTNLGMGKSWPFPASSIKLLTRWSLKSQWLYLPPDEDSSIQLLSIAHNYNGPPYLFSSVWLAQFQKPHATDMNIFYSHSKIDIKLRCNYCIKFQLFEGSQDVFSRLSAVCYMLLPHNLYRLPQPYKRHVCGPSSSCKHRFL